MPRSAGVFRPDPGSVGEARTFVQTLLQRWGVDGDDAVLVLSELATNAVVHGGEPFEVVVAISEERLRVEICDPAPGHPVTRRPSSVDEHGRGLLVVGALSLDWGVEHGPGGKRVWADLPLRRQRR